MVAPAVAYGASGEHQAFAGTLSIGRDATALLLVELARSATETFPRVLYVCAHGGNAEPLNDAVARLRSEGRDVRAWTPRWPGDAHAGQLETSLMLAIAPERVDLARAQAGNRAPIGELMPVLRADGVRAASPNGVLGDPTDGQRRPRTGAAGRRTRPHHAYGARVASDAPSSDRHRRGARHRRRHGGRAGAGGVDGRRGRPM